ncbi:MAG TPA: response regulator, partial [Candidatus Acidoferrum sp.]|nr:response regulator [Candidatus Acidoferrum sp.]
DANDKFLQMLGYAREDLAAGRLDWAHMTPPEYRHLDEASERELTAIGVNARPFEKEYIRKDGSRIPILVAGAMLDEARSNGVAFVLDITSRKQAEEALQQTKVELEHRVQERTEALSLAVQQREQQAAQLRALASELTLAEQRERRRVAEVLHDSVQQLLVAARLQLVGLQRGPDEAVIRTAQEGTDLIGESLATSRSLTYELSPPMLYDGGLVPALEWLTRWAQDKHGLKVALTTTGPVAVEAEDARVLLFQAVRELLFNIVKHAQVQTASVQVERVGDQIRVLVGDDGVGFEPAQLSAEGGWTGGFGLLSIRERLNLLGGRMEIDSAPGQGTRFTLWAPLQRAGMTVPAPVAPERPDGGSSAMDAGVTGDGERKIRVLVVDDHRVVRQGLTRLLSAEPDIEVVAEAADGKAAVELAGQLRPDVVLMDVSMPEMNGVDATRAIHVAFPAVQVIGLSMFEEDELAAMMRKAGAVAYLTKRGPADVLLAAIRARAAAPQA